MKTILLATLSLCTITACAGPESESAAVNSRFERSEYRQQTLVRSGSVSGGACDDVGQFIPSDQPGTGAWALEASAAPTRR